MRLFCFTEAAFLDLHLSISNDIVSTKIYDKRDDFDFEIVNFPFLDGDVPRSTSYGLYISQLIRFARASSFVADFNTHNKLLTQKLLKQGYRYHKLKIISHYKKIGYNINVLQQTACLVVNPITVGNFAFLFNCTPVGGTSDSMMVPT